jgi:hypothetical protein
MKNYNKLFITILAVGVFASFIYANQFECGIKTGLIYSEMKIVRPNSYPATSGPRYGFYGFDIGIIFYAKLIKSLFLEADLRYSPRGYILSDVTEADEYGSIGVFDAKYIIHCISLPLLANYHFLKYFFVSGGPRVDYLISETLNISNHSGSEKLNKIDFGFDFGIGINKSILNHITSSLEIKYSPTITEYKTNCRLTAWEILLGLRI